MEKIPDISGYNFAVPISATHFREVLLKCRNIMKSECRGSWLPVGYTSLNQLREHCDENQILTINALVKAYDWMPTAERMEGEGIRTSSRYSLGKIIISIKMLTDALKKQKLVSINKETDRKKHFLALTKEFT